MTLAWLVAGCALRHAPHYEPVGLELAPVDEGFVESLPAILDRDLRRGRLRSVARAEGGDPARTAPVERFDTLEPEELYALFACQRRWARGAELDLLVDAGRGPRPVTLWIGPRFDVVVGSSDLSPDRVPRPRQVPLDEWSRRLAGRLGVVGFAGEDRRWSEAEIGDVASALSRLLPEEAQVLRGVELVRRSASPRAPAKELAWFDPNTPIPRIEFFDLAFTDDRIGFVGPVYAPIASGVMTALHEFGHLVADEPLRVAYDAYLAAFAAWTAETDPDRATELRAESRARYRAYRRIGSRGPVIEAWEQVRAGRPGPSSYGARSPHESFAEAFALYHVDPAALERALPGAREWFAARGHLAAASPAGAEALHSEP